MPATIAPPEASGRMSAELIRQIVSLSRDSKEHLMVLLQEELDGGPFIGELPEKPMADPVVVQREWKQAIARRIEDMRSDRVERIDAHGAAERLLQKVIGKYSP